MPTLSAAPDALWVAEGTSGKVTRVDPQTDAVRSLHVGGLALVADVRGGVAAVVTDVLPASVADRRRRPRPPRGDEQRPAPAAGPGHRRSGHPDLQALAAGRGHVRKPRRRRAADLVRRRSDGDLPRDGRPALLAALGIRARDRADLRRHARALARARARARRRRPGPAPGRRRAGTPTAPAEARTSQGSRTPATRSRSPSGGRPATSALGSPRRHSAPCPRGRRSCPTASRTSRSPPPARTTSRPISAASGPVPRQSQLPASDAGGVRRHRVHHGGADGAGRPAGRTGGRRLRVGLGPVARARGARRRADSGVRRRALSAATSGRR